QAASYVSAGAMCHVEVALLPGAWVPLPPVPTPPAMTLQELIPPRPPLPPFPQRDAQVSMHKELRKIVSMLIKEYDKLFLQPTDNDHDDDDECTLLSKDDRRQKLIFHLNAEGLYFDFKEKLKKALVAVIREKFPTSTASGTTPLLGALSPPQRHDQTAFFAQLYSYLMEEVHVVLNGVFHGVEVHEAEDDSPDAIRLQLATLKLQAWESEVNGQLKKASTAYTDRVHVAAKHARDIPDLHAPVWFDFALFYARIQDLDKVCLNLYFMARSHGLLAVYYAISQADRTGNLRLHELMQAAALTKSTATFSSPTAECVGIAAYCKDLGLFSLAQDALALGDAVMKPKTVLSTAVLATQKLVLGAIDLHFHRFAEAKQWCQDALDHNPDCADGWYLHGLVASTQNDLAVALASYSQALARPDQLHDMYRLPLYLQLGALFIHHQQWYNTTLLRELSNGFVALDKLEVAESLLRRSLLAGDSSLTRKTLADVLAAQNCASTALDQYKKALEGCSSMGDRAALLARCADLLSMLGRLEEAKEYLDMAQHQQQGADKEALIGRQVQQHHHRVDGP
ncbi:hypothetical protein DYB36_010954, partial [Aphanomyces astaci]